MSQIRPRLPATRLAMLIRGLIVLAIGGGLMMQAQSGDWFPPEHSMSQYANGPGRTAFTVALAALGLAAAGLAALTMDSDSLPIRGVAAFGYAAAAVGFVLAAVVRAELAHQQGSLVDRVHMAGSISGLVGVTIASLLVAGARRHTRVGMVCLVVAAAAALALIMLVAAAYGIEPTGLGERPAWALYQTIALVSLVALMLVLPSAIVGSERTPDGGPSV